MPSPLPSTGNASTERGRASTVGDKRPASRSPTPTPPKPKFQKGSSKPPQLSFTNNIFTLDLQGPEGESRSRTDLNLNKSYKKPEPSKKQVNQIYDMETLCSETEQDVLKVLGRVKYGNGQLTFNDLYNIALKLLPCFCNAEGLSFTAYLELLPAGTYLCSEQLVRWLIWINPRIVLISPPKKLPNFTSASQRPFVIDRVPQGRHEVTIEWVRTLIIQEPYKKYLNQPNSQIQALVSLPIVCVACADNMETFQLNLPDDAGSVTITAVLGLKKKRLLSRAPPASTEQPGPSQQSRKSVTGQTKKPLNALTFSNDVLTNAFGAREAFVTPDFLKTLVLNTSYQRPSDKTRPIFDLEPRCSQSEAGRLKIDFTHIYLGRMRELTEEDLLELALKLERILHKHEQLAYKAYLAKCLPPAYYSCSDTLIKWLIWMTPRILVARTGPSTPMKGRGAAKEVRPFAVEDDVRAIQSGAKIDIINILSFAVQDAYIPSLNKIILEEKLVRFSPRCDTSLSS